MIDIQLVGRPVAQGSMSAFVVGKKDGPKRAVVAQGGSRQSRNDLARYRGDLREEAQKSMRDRPPLRGPVDIEITFLFERPKAHYGTGRNSEVVKDSAPRHKTSAPDLDKLVRSVLDALTGVVFEDDAQIVRLITAKSYYKKAGTRVRAWPMPAGTRTLSDDA